MGKAKILNNKFRGKSEHVLDAKGRLNFPSRYREILKQYESEVLMVTAWDKCLRAFPVSEWEKFENILLAKGKEQPGLGKMVRLLVSGVVDCPLDKQGRILLPATLRNDIGIQKEIVINGMLDSVEIWNRDAWIAENQAARDNFENFEESLSKLGVF